jgi:hypothetical protein
MDDWAEYCASDLAADGAKVTAIRRATGGA